MFFFYQISLILLIFLSPFIVLFRIFKKKEDKFRFIEKFGLLTKKRKLGNIIWFHVSSVGELMSITPLLYHYENKKKINQILVTTNTLSSANIIKKYKFKKTIHQFFPIDSIFISQKFLNYWKPKIAIFVESEIWPGIFYSLSKKNIPIVLLNARITEKTYKRWFSFKNFSYSVFKNIVRSYPQNYESIKYLRKLKVKNIKYIGNLKFSENPFDKKDTLNKQLNLKFKSYNNWVAASTHDNEEIICATAHKILKNKIKNLITIIIPRHVNRVDAIISEIKKLKLTVVRHSEKVKNLENVDIYLVDTYGESKKFYKITNTVFLGGSLIKHGGQNPLEPARYGARILHGSNVQNFKDIYKFLHNLSVSKNINNAVQLASSILFRPTKNKNNRIKQLGKKILIKTAKELDTLIKNAI
jgi:3-deoxy-D-manno-octulosonic-acid transferase